MDAVFIMQKRFSVDPSEISHFLSILSFDKLTTEIRPTDQANLRRKKTSRPHSFAVKPYTAIHFMFFD